ncbi:MAG: hypothetical protein ACXVB9_11485 [Bdellovibrionota bacterium]
MSAMKAFLISLLLCSSTALANGPNENQALEAYFKSKDVSQAIDSLKLQHYEVQGTSAVAVHGLWNDEGFDATYLVSTYLRRGSNPGNSQTATVLAIVYRNAGLIEMVRLLDSQKAESALWSIK